MPLAFPVAVYEVIGDPPLSVGAVKVTDAVVAPVEVAVTEVGALGTVIVGVQVFVWLSERPAFIKSDVVTDLPQYS